MRATLLLFLLTVMGLSAQDRRNVEIRHTDFEFQPPDFGDPAAWKSRSASLRKQVLMASGLLPLPDRTPLNPQVFGRTEGPDYTIEKVLLETRPGFFLGANLYRPKDKTGPFPAVVSPHGHWAYGRIEHGELGSIPARAINLAKQGFVVLTYDMVGYNDTMQLPHAAIGGKREEMWGVGLLGAQLWNSIRAVDFLETLSDVDPQRIGATGASGGATQTFLLSAVDDRIAFSAPVNMISLIMQGGSPCENAPNLRIETNNVEIAGMAAPRPMLAVSATGDWTKNLPRNEGPALASLYSMLGSPDAFEFTQFDSPHNYHQGSREAVYRFFGRKVLGDAEPTHFAEKSFRTPNPSDLLSLWNRTLPEHAVFGVEHYVEERIREANVELLELRPRSAATLHKARQAFRERLTYATMAFEPAPADIESEVVEPLPNGEKLVIGRRGHGERIPAVYLKAAKPLPAARPTLIVHPEGGAWTLSSAESREGLVARLLAAGGDVMAIDAFQTAHATAPRDIAGAGRRAETYFTTFNRTDTANRILDVVTAIPYLRERTGAREINLVCLGEAGPWCALARAVAGGSIHMAADLHQFDASSDDAFVEKLFIPHLRKAGDFRAAATLWVEGGALLFNAATGFPQDWVRASFEAAGMSDQLTLLGGPVADEALIGWLTMPSTPVIGEQ